MNNARRLIHLIFEEEYEITLWKNWIDFRDPSNIYSRLQVTSYNWDDNTINGQVLDHRGLKL